MKGKGIIISCLLLLLLVAFLYRPKSSAFGNREIDGELSRAAWEGNITQMKSLVARGANVNKTCCGRVPPLHAAAYGGHNEAIGYLLAQGSQVDIGGKFNETALLIAAQEGYLETVKLLVANGANVNAYDEMDFSTPLKLAKEKKHLEVTTFLASQGAQESIWWHRFFKH